MIETVIRTRLLADPTVAGYVGSRIYAMRMPQKAVFPALVYQRISDFTETGLGVVGPIRARIQLSAWAVDTDAANGFDTARALALAARLSLEGYADELSDEVIVGVFHRGGRDAPYDAEAKVYGHQQDFEVVYKAAVAA